jgi:hypothetical protein
MAYLGSIIGNGGTGIAGNPLIGSGGSGSGTVTSVGTDATLSGGPITSSGTIGLALGNANTWTAAQTFSGGITGTLTGAASLNLLLTGGALTGAVTSNSSIGTTATFNDGATPILSVFTASNLGSPIALGANAGGMGAGWGPTTAWTTIGTENVFVGNNVCSWLTSTVGVQGFGITAIGQSVGSQESNGYQWTGTGNDCFRNTSGILQSVGVGQNANRNYMGYGCVAIGYQALLGNNQSIQLSGTITTGDVISATFTSTQLTGSPITVSTPAATGGTTLQTQAAALAVAINANATLAAWFTAEVLSNQIPTVTIETSAIGLGAAIPANMTYVITGSSSGAATEIVTIGVCSSSYTENVAIGYQNMLGLQMTTAANNISFGATNLWALTTGIGNFVAGQNSGNVMTTANDCIGIGRTVLQKNISASGVIAIGNSAAQNATVAMTMVGNNAGQNLTSGAGNTGFGSSVLKGAANSTAAFNSAFGVSVFVGITSGTDNCGFGYAVGGALTTGTGSILIGFETGQTGLTTGGSNIWINAGSTKYDPANASNTLFIGANGIGAITGTSISTAGSVALVMPSGLLTLGTASTYGATLVLEGSTSGSVTLTGGTTGLLTVANIGNGASALTISGAGQWTANGTTTVTLTALGPAGANTTVQKWLTLTDNGGVVRYIPCF